MFMLPFVPFITASSTPFSTSSSPLLSIALAKVPLFKVMVPPVWLVMPVAVPLPKDFASSSVMVPLLDTLPPSRPCVPTVTVPLLVKVLSMVPLVRVNTPALPFTVTSSPVMFAAVLSSPMVTLPLISMLPASSPLVRSLVSVPAVRSRVPLPTLLALPLM